MKKQTAGHELLGDFAPQFAHLNDDVLFGEVWSREQQLPAHQRSMITIAELISGGNFEQLKAHFNIGKQNGITGVVCGRGRNPTLRLWPTIFSGKIDVFPGDRRSRLISSMTSVAPA